MLPTIQSKLTDHTPITRAEAAWLFTQASDEVLQQLAGQVRARFHPPDQATYLLMAIVNYTNVCVARCDYCSFYRMPGQPDTYLLSFEQVCAKIDALEALGGTLIGFNGGFHPDLRVRDYIELFSRVRARYGERLTFYEMTVAEFMFVAKRSKLSYDKAAQQFAESGTRWITGGGAEVLDESFRHRHSKGTKFTVSDYYDAQRAILQAGIGSTATMVIGFDETLDERLNHLEGLRAFQDQTGGLLPSLLCWTYKPYGNELGGTEIDPQEYLRWLAVCRIYLHNIVHLRTSVLTQNERALMGLRYGANDFDLPTEDEVTEKAGATISHQFQELLGQARALGVAPVHRRPWAVPQPGD